jgi:hypothetical protein
MSQLAGDIEGLLRQALAPVEPPEDFAVRLDSTLQNLADLAAEELETWELASMRDPRNWLRPVAAGVIGAAAGTALVALRVQSGRKKRRASASDPLDYAEQTVRAVADEARRLLDR